MSTFTDTLGDLDSGYHNNHHDPSITKSFFRSKIDLQVTGRYTPILGSCFLALCMFSMDARALSHLICPTEVSFFRLDCFIGLLNVSDL